MDDRAFTNTLGELQQMPTATGLVATTAAGFGDAARSFSLSTAIGEDVGSAGAADLAACRSEDEA
jgi:hypothetical protein